MAFLNMDWGDKGGKFFELWKLEPCCGKPCNVKDGAYCCLTWWCLGLCNVSKLYAASLDQDCALINHLLPSWCCGYCVAIVLRRNIRKKYGIGQDDVMNWIGDWACFYCCGYCSFGQILRAVEIKDWDWISDVKAGGVRVKVDPFKMLRQ